MHGIKRIKQSAEALEARRRKEQAKLKEYLALTDQVLSRRDQDDWSLDAFHLTTRLLTVNPEFYTIWNYRRRILLHGIFPQSTPQDIYDTLCEDLGVTMQFLKSHPKVYWIWNHRRWCLESVPDAPVASGLDSDSSIWRKRAWDKELEVVEKLLNADARNFHAWDYRRYILANIPVPRPETAELAYTKRKIESNFSNFSAWHQRSKVFSSLWANDVLDKDKCKEEEFDLVRNAMYTDPNDQSVWMYHRWLVGSDATRELLDREITAIQELLSQEPENKWCMESMVHYKRMLLDKGLSDVERTRTVAECRTFLERLQNLDPYRLQRYRDILQTLI
ncbi:hypothetical protein AX16_008644 [Volvariella volvacea WC 439]|nr:hypothetical protein AX16_008644 [Volvariella volvacea WC 439]